MWVKMPRVVPDQRSKFENEEFFRKLSRECEVSLFPHTHTLTGSIQSDGGNKRREEGSLEERSVLAGIVSAPAQVTLITFAPLFNKISVRLPEIGGEKNSFL